MSALAVDASRLTMRFGAFTAVDDVSLRVERGEIFGFLGANGAGKTTTIRILCGLLLPTAGAVSIAGINLHDDPDGVKAATGYMSQRFTLYTDLTVAENLAFKGGLYKIPPATLAARTAELLGFVGFDRDPGQMVRDLPGGIKQEVSLAAALLHDPAVIFLDEPTAGVAPASRERFWTLIRRLAATGKTVFVTTHYMDEAEQCGRIAMMRAGKVIALDSPAGLKHSAFPGTLAELEVPPDAPAGWESRVTERAGVQRLSPHGLRWHAALAPGVGLDALTPALPSGTAARLITPTLEDVFLRLAEG